MSDTYRLKRRATVAALHAEGLTNEQIAARINLKYAAVSLHVRRLGLLPNVQVRSKTGITLDKAPWEIPDRDRAETAPRGASYMVSRPRTPAHEPDADSIVAAIRAEHRRVVA